LADKKVDKKGYSSSMSPTNDVASLGYWIRRRRKALDLTQARLAQQVGCAVATIKKIEADERRPSREMAERLADCLGILHAERVAFLRVARAGVSPQRLAVAPSVDAPAHSPVVSATHAPPKRWPQTTNISCRGT
jgi:DNA-binding XRE family transcriptional regulator